MKNNRRSFLQLLGLGGTAATTQLPGAWTKPIVEAVQVPAHARTTSDCEDLSLVLEETLVWDPTSVVVGQPLRITATITNIGDITRDISLTAVFLPFTGPFTDLPGSDFQPGFAPTLYDPLTLSPGETATYDVEGAASPCFGSPTPNQSQVVLAFFDEASTCENEFVVERFTACTQP